MRILLVGEYSNLHNTLKVGLKRLNHEVTLVSTGDYFKNFDSDIKIKMPFKKSWLKKINSIFFRILKIDLNAWYVLHQFKQHQQKFVDFDVVQLINQTPFDLYPKHEKNIFDFLKSHNKKIFILSCGIDSHYLEYASQHKDFLSVLKPYFKNKLQKKGNQHVFKYLLPDFKSYYQYLLSNSNGFIATDIDYLIPMKNHSKLLGFIPYPLNIPTIVNQQKSKITILHGINSVNFIKKGNDVFSKVLKKIALEYPEIVIKETRDLPFKIYQKELQEADILLDQMYANDQGYNALIAMSYGKVVFTGASDLFLEHYQLKNKQVCIHATDDEAQLYTNLKEIIEDDKLRQEISQNAIAFVKEHHDVKIVTNKYLELWHNH